MGKARNSFSSTWSKYMELNTEIAAELFGPETVGRPVYLDFQTDSLSRVINRVEGKELDEPQEWLIDVVRATLPNPKDHTGLFREHAKRALQWEEVSSLSPPPCIALLAVFSLVAEQMERSEEFAESNYYGRLLLAFKFGDEFRDKLGRDFRQDTPALWNALNRWLVDSEGRRGLPTANAFDRRRFVGLPISQALVRIQDRAKLPLLFTQFGMQPGQRIAIPGMIDLLEEWFPSSPVTLALSRMWRNSVNKERIAEIVCSELEGWDGMVPVELKTEEYKDHENLLLAAETTSHPKSSIEFLLLVRQQVRSAPRAIALSESASTLAKAAFGQLREGICLNPLPGTSWETVAPERLISYPELLIANVSLTVKGGETSLSRFAKRMVLLKWCESENLYVEVNRVELLEAYIILAVPDLVEQIREVLHSSARQGWQEMNYDLLLGLPFTWTAFVNVQLESVQDGLSANLDPLRPITRTHLAISGGLPLPGMKVWHVQRLPEVRVVVDQIDNTEEILVQAKPVRQLVGAESAPIRIGEMTRTAVFDLSTIPELQVGDFRLEVTSSLSTNRMLASATLRIRSGAWPRLVEDEMETNIGHKMGDRECLEFFAERLNPQCQRNILMGSYIETESSTESAKSSAQIPIPIRPGLLLKEQDQDIWYPDQPVKIDEAREKLTECFEKGYHVFYYPLRKGRETIYGVCRYCGLEKWRDPPDRRYSTRYRRQTPRIYESGPSKNSCSNLSRISLSKKADMNLVLDALSYARSGSWRSLSAITSWFEDTPWFSREVARRLEALGHIQVEMDKQNFTPLRWCVAPPTVVQSESGRCYLAGRRSSTLIDSVQDIVINELGGCFETNPQPNGPDVLEIVGLDLDELLLLVEEVSQYRDHELSLSILPASFVTTKIPTLSDIRNSLPELKTLFERTERLDLMSGKWVAASRLDRPGAYRVRSRPFIYTVVPTSGSSDQRTVVSDGRIAKYLAGHDASFSLIGYDSEDRTLFTSLGAPLPGLFERAAVLCSGYLPHVDVNDGTLAYRDVPQKIANSVWMACTKRPELSISRSTRDFL